MIGRGLGCRPLAVMAKPSGHGDVHEIIVARTNGDSLTIAEFERVFAAVTGHPIDTVEPVRGWFAEEDR